MGKAFEKEIKTIEDQGPKQVDALESLKPKEQKKQTIEDKSNNQPKAAQLYLMNLLQKKRINKWITWQCWL